MAKTYNDHSYSGAQMIDPIIKPHIQDKALTQYGITVETTPESSYEFSEVEVGDEYVRGYKNGFQGGASGKFTDKKFALAEFKKETNWSMQKYRQRIQRLAARMGIAMNNDTSGTAIARLEIELHAQGVRTGVFKSFWLGDTSKTVDDGSGNNIPDERYNTADGIWTEIKNRQSADNIARVKLSGTGVSASLVSGGALQLDAAREVMRELYNVAPERLKMAYDEGQAAFYVTRPMGENYIETLESDGTSEAHNKLINGVERFTFRGIPIYDMNISGSLLKDFANDAPFRVILTVPENLAMVVGYGSMSESRFWFNADENENRQRTQFEMEHGFVAPDLLAVAY